MVVVTEGVALVEEAAMRFSQAMALSLLLGIVGSASPVAVVQAETLTADIAKNCRELMIKAYPPRRPGIRHGNAQEQRAYFRACVAQAAKPR